MFLDRSLGEISMATRKQTCKIIKVKRKFPVRRPGQLHNKIIMSETILEIAYQFMLEQNKNEKILHGTNERTIFVLGSKGVVSVV
jgi:hypothetical protein